MSEYLIFERRMESKRKTAIVIVRSRNRGDILGSIVWRGTWRQYVFEPFPDTVFSDGCLEAIRNHIQGLMLERKKPQLPGSAQT